MTRSHWNWEKTYRDGLKKQQCEDEEEDLEQEIKLTSRADESHHSSNNKE